MKAYTSQVKKKLIDDLNHLDIISTKNAEIIQRLDEFIVLLENSEIDSENVQYVKEKVNTALDHKLNNGKLIKEIKALSLRDVGDLEQLNLLEQLLNNNHLDSRQVERIRVRESVNKLVISLIGFLFIVLGFAMIILPAPPYFELFTIFYFNENDGITLMDLISLIIIVTGIFVMIKPMLRTRRNG